MQSLLSSEIINPASLRARGDFVHNDIDLKCLSFLNQDSSYKYTYGLTQICGRGTLVMRQTYQLFFLFDCISSFGPIISITEIVLTMVNSLCNQCFLISTKATIPTIHANALVPNRSSRPMHDGVVNRQIISCRHNKIHLKLQTSPASDIIKYT